MSCVNLSMLFFGVGRRNSLTRRKTKLGYLHSLIPTSLRSRFSRIMQSALNVPSLICKALICGIQESWNCSSKPCWDINSDLIMAWVEENRLILGPYHGQPKFSERSTTRIEFFWKIWPAFPPLRIEGYLKCDLPKWKNWLQCSEICGLRSIGGVWAGI